MVHLTAVTLTQWRKLVFWWLLHNIGGSFLVDFIENEIVGFDDNLAVVL